MMMKFRIELALLNVGAGGSMNIAFNYSSNVLPTSAKVQELMAMRGLPPSRWKVYRVSVTEIINDESVKNHFTNLFQVEILNAMGV